SWPIRWRLTALNVGVLALTLALLGGVMLLQLDSALISITTDHLRDEARLAVPPAIGPGGPGGPGGEDQPFGPRPPEGFGGRGQNGPDNGAAGQGFGLTRMAGSLVRRLTGPDTGALVFDQSGTKIAESALDADVEDWPHPTDDQLQSALAGAEIT